MRRSLSIFSLIMATALILGLSSITKAGDADSGWLTNWDKAVELAKKEKKVILVDFTGSDWCGWCIKLKKEVFDTDDFKKWAKDNVILLELDFPRKSSQDEKLKEQNKKLMTKYNVRGFPTILFLDAEGKVIGKSGYKAGGPATWTEDASKIIKAGTK